MCTYFWPVYRCFHDLSRASMSCCRWSSSLCVQAIVVMAWEVYCLMEWRRRPKAVMVEGWVSSLLSWGFELKSISYPSNSAESSISFNFTYHFPLKRQFWTIFRAPRNPHGYQWLSMAIHGHPWRLLLALRPKTCVWASLGEVAMAMGPPEMDGWMILWIMPNMVINYKFSVISHNL